MCLVVDFMNNDVAHNRRRRLERWYCEFIQKGIVFGICLRVRNQSALAQDVILLLKSLLLTDSGKGRKSILANIRSGKRFLVDTQTININIRTLRRRASSTLSP